MEKNKKIEKEVINKTAEELMKEYNAQTPETSKHSYSEFSHRDVEDGCCC